MLLSLIEGKVSLARADYSMTYNTVNISDFSEALGTDPSSATRAYQAVFWTRENSGN